MEKITYIVMVRRPEVLAQFVKKYHVNSPENRNVQWIVLDRSASAMEDTWKKAVLDLRRHPRIVYRGIKGVHSDASCYQKALRLAEDGLVCFTEDTVSYEPDAAARVLSAAERFPEETMFLLRHRAQSVRPPLPYKRAAAKVLGIEKAMGRKVLPQACFYRTGSILGEPFNDACDAETLTAFFLNRAVRTSSLVRLDHVICEFDPDLLSQQSDRHFGCDDPNYYIPSFEKIYLPLERFFTDSGKKVPLWMQKEIFFQIYFRYYANLNARHRFLLNEEEKKVFFRLTAQLLSVVSDEVILSNMKGKKYDPALSMRNVFLHLKYGGDPGKLHRRFLTANGVLYFGECGELYDLSRHQNIVIKAFNLRDGKLCIDANFFTYMLYLDAPDAVYALVNGEKREVTPTGCYALDKLFGESVEKRYTFLLEVPLEELYDRGTIRFCLELDGKVLHLPLDFNRAPSMINGNCVHSYWMMDDTHMLVYEDDALAVKTVTGEQIKARERLYEKEIPGAVQRDFLNAISKGRRPDAVNYTKSAAECIRVRREYYARRESMKGRRIWLYFDKLFKAGDNGEYAFRYAYENDPEIESYYVVNDTAADYARLKEEFKDRILVYGTHECRMMALFAEAVVATHPDIIEYFGFSSLMTRYVKDLFTAKLICIAHGITIQKNADYQNRLYDNTMFYTTSSKYEVAHIRHPIYGYREDEVALTGLARFDGLKSKDCRQILITPTWRRNLVGNAERNSAREYSEVFKASPYYRIYNSLINDPRIIETAKNCGYRVIFLLHPAMSTQIDDYDRNDYVDLIPASGDMSYEKILTESSLMITDYSGIHYDFGYMRKPIIYYQPKEIPMRFEEGGMKFATMAFGPVCTEYDEAVSLICRQMENGCVMEPEYRRRADDFFAFDDYNSCSRIHAAIKTWVGKQS